jgi:hypothetical protein
MRDGFCAVYELNIKQYSPFQEVDNHQGEMMIVAYRHKEKPILKKRPNIPLIMMNKGKFIFEQ